MHVVNSLTVLWYERILLFPMGLFSWTCKNEASFLQRIVVVLYHQMVCRRWNNQCLDSRFPPTCNNIFLCCRSPEHIKFETRVKVMTHISQYTHWHAPTHMHIIVDIFTVCLVLWYQLSTFFSVCLSTCLTALANVLRFIWNVKQADDLNSH